MENIEVKLNELGSKLDQKIELTSKELGEEFKKELKGEIAEQIEKFNTLQKQVDQLDVDIQKTAESRKEEMTFTKALGEQLKTNDSLRAFKNGESSKARLNMKATLTTAANASGEVIAADRVAGIKFDPTRSVRVRDIITNGNTASDTIRYVQENAYTNNAAMRTEASAYGESEFILEYKDAPVRSLGSTITMSKEMLEDVAQMNSYISARLPQKVLNIEDARILFGDGSAPNIQGIMTSAGGTEFDESSTAAFYEFFAADASGEVNEYDVLVAAINQTTLVEYSPSAILVNPTDYHKMILRKATDGQYVAELQNKGTIMGIPVIKNTAVTADKFLVGDFNLGAQLFLRKDMMIEFSDQNEDNFEKDLVTVKASERIALPIYRPNAFAWGTFSTAITSLHA